MARPRIPKTLDRILFIHLVKIIYLHTCPTPSASWRPRRGSSSRAPAPPQSTARRDPSCTCTRLSWTWTRRSRRARGTYAFCFWVVVSFPVYGEGRISIRVQLSSLLLEQPEHIGSGREILRVRDVVHLLHGVSSLGSSPFTSSYKRQNACRALLV